MEFLQPEQLFSLGKTKYYLSFKWRTTIFLLFRYSTYRLNYLYMSREIKFRAFNVRKNYMFDPMPIIDFKVFEINNIPLMQFTGLTDDNNSDIFEGDILQFGAQLSSIGEVKFLAKNAGFLVKDKFEDWRWLYDVVASTNVKVIGNVWQNPELIK